MQRRRASVFCTFFFLMCTKECNKFTTSITVIFFVATIISQQTHPPFPSTPTHPSHSSSLLQCTTDTVIFRRKVKKGFAIQLLMVAGCAINFAKKKNRKYSRFTLQQIPLKKTWYVWVNNIIFLKWFLLFFIIKLAMYACLLAHTGNSSSSFQRYYAQRY